jgi:Zn-dependent peptidase ImmA (M78 family)/DNA-binding XRE family transcriptional regulator
MPDTRELDPKALGERLALARKEAGKTQEEAAEHLGLSRPTFIAIEKGTRPVQPEELIKLAAFYGRTVHELLRPGMPVALEPHLRAVVNHRRREAPELMEAIKELERFAEDYRELEQLLSAPLSANYPPEIRLPTRGNLYEFAEDVATRERARLSLGDGPILNLRKILESEVGVRIFYSSMPPAIAGMYAFVADLGYCILINRVHPPERQRASLAHEYGHFLSDRHKPGIDYLNDDGRKPTNERFAEAFSMAFLVPKVGVRRQFNEVLSTTQDFQVADLVRLASFYFVSVQAMALRLEGLNLIGKGWWGYLMELGFKPNQVKAELELPARSSEGEDIYPERYKFLAVHAYKRGLVSEGRLARYLRTDRVSAREIVAECLTRLETQADGMPAVVRLPFEQSRLEDPS